MPFPVHRRESPGLRDKQRNKESESLHLSKNIQNGMAVVLGALEWLYRGLRSTVHRC
jgi:hypothetical protein